MRLIGKLIIIIFIVGILLGASAYVILYTSDNDNNNNGGNDIESPQIDDIAGNLTVTAGQTVTITALFSDNVNVTVATLYYKVASSTSWDSISILSGSASISIPSSTTSNYHYYITIDDDAGNGPIGQPSVDGTTFYIITVTHNGGEENFTHTVFVEEATATWCNNCPNVANILHAIYETHNYRFYYVSLVDDKSTKAHERLSNDYNVLGFPTAFIDGGYSVIVGGAKPESDYSAAIAAAQVRTVPNIQIKVAAEYKNTTGELTVTAVVENKENQLYSGRLKIYLTEIVSGWTGYDSKPYQFSFLEYILLQDISVDGNGTETFTETKDISAYDYENLMIIGVVFSSEKHAGYANPPSENPFDAYYADATNAAKIVEGGNLPPQLEITSPQKGKIYLNGNPVLERLQNRKILGLFLNNSLHNKTILLGQKTITVDATDDSAVAKVEFYIDEKLVFNDTQAPYEYTFKKLSTFKTLFFKKHILTVTVYDDTGKITSASILFKARI